MQACVQQLPFEKVNVSPTTNDVVYAVLSRAADATFAYTIRQPAFQKMMPRATLPVGPELWSVPTGLGRLLQKGTSAALSLKHFGRDMRCES